MNDDNTSGHYFSPDGSDDVFFEVMKKFKQYDKEHGKFLSISKEFKSRLFEMFINNSGNKDNSNLGKYFTPLRVVREMVDMVTIRPGMSICDPACGVGKFLLEAASSDMSVFNAFKYENGHLVTPLRLYGFEKDMNENGKTDITVILAKANALLYFSELFKKNNTLSDIPVLANELLNGIFSKTADLLGTLRTCEHDKYDLILANPPYYSSSSLAKKAAETGLYSYTNGGMQILFLEWIIKSLVPNGTANIVLPNNVFSSVGSSGIKAFIKEKCIINAIISLPVKTFYNTAQKTYILNITKKNPTETYDDNKIFTYLCSSIGESLDASRLPEKSNDLHDAVSLYNLWRNLSSSDKECYPTYIKEAFANKRLKFIDSSELLSENSWIIEKWWSEEEKQELGIIDRITRISAKEFEIRVNDLKAKLDEYKDYVNTDDESDDVKYKEVPVKEILLYASGNQGLTKKVIHFDEYYDDSEKKYDVIVLSSSLLDETSMGRVSEDLMLSKNRRLKVFKDKEGVLVSRNGNAGVLSYLPKDKKYALTDHAYILYLKKKYIEEIDLKYLTMALQKESEKYITISDGNKTWSITLFMNKGKVSIPVKKKGRKYIFDLGKQRELAEKDVFIKEMKKYILDSSNYLTSVNVE